MSDQSRGENIGMSETPDDESPTGAEVVRRAKALPDAPDAKSQATVTLIPYVGRAIAASLNLIDQDSLIDRSGSSSAPQVATRLFADEPRICEPPLSIPKKRFIRVTRVRGLKQWWTC